MTIKLLAQQRSISRRRRPRTYGNAVMRDGLLLSSVHQSFIAPVWSHTVPRGRIPGITNRPCTLLAETRGTQQLQPRITAMMTAALPDQDFFGTPARTRADRNSVVLSDADVNGSVFTYCASTISTWYASRTVICKGLM